MLKQLFYQTIYHPKINYVLRNINKSFSGLFPQIQLPPSGKLRLKIKNGDTIDFYTNQTDHVSSLIFWNGLYNYEYIDIFEDIFKKCKGFIDVGANSGIYSLMAAKTSPQTTTIAFDASDAAFYYLTKNIRSNHLEKIIHPFRNAVSNENNKLSFYKVKNPKYPFLKHNLGGASSLINKPEKYNVINVDTVILDEFLEKSFPELSIDLVKIDAEGAEPNVLQGLKKTIAKYSPIITCEILFDDILTDLQSECDIFLNYGIYFHLDKKLVRVEAFSNKSIYGDKVRNCFLIPHEKTDWFKNWIV